MLETTNEFQSNPRYEIRAILLGRHGVARALIDIYDTEEDKTTSTYVISNELAVSVIESSEGEPRHERVTYYTPSRVLVHEGQTYLVFQNIYGVIVDHVTVNTTPRGEPKLVLRRATPEFEAFVKETH